MALGWLPLVNRASTHCAVTAARERGGHLEKLKSATCPPAGSLSCRAHLAHLALKICKKRKFPAGPGEATENHFTFASGGWGYPPDPH
jgi:hypothetical protein